MGVEYVTLRISLHKGRYVDPIQWDSTRKGPIARDNLYGYGVLGMGYTIYARYGQNFMETACPKREPWFAKFMKGLKLWMGVIKNHDFGVISEMIKYFLEGWDTEFRSDGIIMRRDISCLNAAVVIDFCGGFWGEEVFLTSLKGVLKLWEETRNKKDLSHIMVTLKGQFKGKAGEKWHILLLVDTAESRIEVMKRVGG